MRTTALWSTGLGGAFIAASVAASFWGHTQVLPKILAKTTVSTAPVQWFASLEWRSAPAPFVDLRTSPSEQTTVSTVKTSNTKLSKRPIRERSLVISKAAPKRVAPRRADLADATPVKSPVQSNDTQEFEQLLRDLHDLGEWSNDDADISTLRDIHAELQARFELATLTTQEANQDSELGEFTGELLETAELDRVLNDFGSDAEVELGADALAFEGVGSLEAEGWQTVPESDLVALSPQDQNAQEDTSSQAFLVSQVSSVPGDTFEDSNVAILTEGDVVPAAVTEAAVLDTIRATKAASVVPPRAPRALRTPRTPKVSAAPKAIKTIPTVKPSQQQVQHRQLPQHDDVSASQVLPQARAVARPSVVAPSPPIERELISQPNQLSAASDSSGGTEEARDEVNNVASVVRGGLLLLPSSDNASGSNVNTPTSQPVAPPQVVPPLETAPGFDLAGPWAEAFDWTSTVALAEAEPFTHEGSNELGGRWIQVTAPRHRPTLYWKTGAAPVALLSDNALALLGVSTGIQQKVGSGLVLGIVPAGWKVALSGRAEEALYFDSNRNRVDANDVSRDRAFLFMNTRPGSQMVSLLAADGRGTGVAALPVLPDTVSWLDLREQRVVEIEGMVYEASSASAKPVSGVAIQVLGQASAVSVTSRRGKFKISNVRALSGHPVYVQLEGRNRFAHRYRIDPQDFQAANLFALDPAQVEEWISQVEGGVSSEGGIIVTAAASLVARHQTRELLGSHEALVGNTSLVPESYGLTARGELRVNEPLVIESPRLIGLQIPEGPIRIAVENRDHETLWSEIVFSSPRVISIVNR